MLHILIEFSEATRTRMDPPAADMFSFMHRAGYTVSDVSVGSDTPLDYARLVLGDFAGVPPNLLQPQRRRADLRRDRRLNPALFE